MKVLYYDGTSVRPFRVSMDRFYLVVFWDIDGTQILLLGPNTIISHQTLVRTGQACSEEIPSETPQVAGHLDVTSQDGLSWGSQDFGISEHDISLEHRRAVVAQLCD